MIGLSTQAMRQSGRTYRGRWVLIGFAVCAVVFLIVPNILVWVGTRDLCPAQVTSRGTNDGTRWEVLRNDCGGDIGLIWQLRVIPDKGYSSVVMQSRGGPEPVGWTQSGFEGQVHLSSSPIGLSSTTVPIKLDPKGQPLGSVEFENGRMKP